MYFVCTYISFISGSFLNRPVRIMQNSSTTVQQYSACCNTCKYSTTVNFTPRKGSYELTREKKDTQADTIIKPSFLCRIVLYKDCCACCCSTLYSYSIPMRQGRQGERGYSGIQSSPSFCKNTAAVVPCLSGSFVISGIPLPVSGLRSQAHF